VEDLGSTNGTFVNSERISQASRLARGDLLQIGATVFEVRR
jgi:pSer/pThr/pTyr-binding forkhead associated (FHA) protein